MAASWSRRLPAKRLSFGIQYHAEQDPNELRPTSCDLWALLLDVDASLITLQRKSNSRQPNGRGWRSNHGGLTESVSDTLLSARLHVWIDRIREDWALDSATRSGA
jgi:hypothetical protein